MTWIWLDYDLTITQLKSIIEMSDSLSTPIKKLIPCAAHNIS